MSDEKMPPKDSRPALPTGKPGEVPQPSPKNRAERQAEELRRNLQRRKAQQRQRQP